MIKETLPIQTNIRTPFVTCPKVPRSYLSQLDLLTHEDEDICGIGGRHGSVSMGVKPENKAQAEPSSSPFH